MKASSLDQPRRAVRRPDGSRAIWKEKRSAKIDSPLWEVMVLVSRQVESYEVNSMDKPEKAYKNL